MSLAENPVSAKEGNCYTRTNDWEAFITKLGFKQESANGMIDPGFNMIRYTESGKHWLLATLGLRWRVLRGLREESTIRLGMRQDKKRRGVIHHAGNSEINFMMHCRKSEFNSDLLSKQGWSLSQMAQRLIHA